MLQLDPPIPVDTPKGPALAVVLLDYGPDYDLMWVTFADDTGACWTWKNSDIRGVKNISLGRRSGEDKTTARPVPLRAAPAGSAMP
jgi:hypothetical protein